MSLERLRDIAHTVEQVLEKARKNTVVRGLGYGLVILLGFGAVINLVVGIIAGIQGEWMAAVGLVLLGGGLVLACEVIVDFLVGGEESNSTSAH